MPLPSSLPRPALLASALTLTATLALTGCGAQVADSSSDSAKGGRPAKNSPVTIENCGKKVTFDQVPERVVTNDIGITEIMFALGLEDRMAGYAMPDEKGDLSRAPWKGGYDKTKWLSKEQITREMILDANADLVFAGWNYGFGEDGVTPEKLAKDGIDSYVLTESCRNGRGAARGIMPPLKALYTDLRTLGKLFGVEDRAERLIAGFKRRVAAIEEKNPQDRADRPRVFLYDSGEDKPFTSGRYAAPDEIIAKAGGVNTMHDLKDSWVTTGWETVVERDPEVLLIVDYGEVSADRKKKFLLNHPALAEVTAVKKKQVYVLDYVDLVESPRNPAAIEALATYLRTIKN